MAGNINKSQEGRIYESLAVDFLKEKGYQILATNFHCKMGEADIIAKDNEYLVFVEVKYRANAGSGDPAEAVGFAKQKKISRVCDYYLMTHTNSEVSVRFDVIAVLGNNIKHFVNAFEYIHK